MKKETTWIPNEVNDSVCATSARACGFGACVFMFVIMHVRVAYFCPELLNPQAQVPTLTCK